MKVTVIDLGKMGTEIITNLLRSGHAVRVYNRTADQARALESRGARVALALQESVSHAQVVLGPNDRNASL